MTDGLIKQPIQRIVTFSSLLGYDWVLMDDFPQGHVLMDVDLGMFNFFLHCRVGKWL